jgi:hypothetical protein
MSATSESGGVRETLQRLTEPLKSELVEIDRQITKLTVELSGLRETQRNVKFVLARLDPSFATKKTAAGRPRGASRTPDVLAFLQSHDGALGEDYGYSNVFKAMKDAKMAIGKEMVRAAFSELHEQGVLRMTRTTSGGGKAYTLVGHA